jgi:signal transduction histidine kinase
LRVLSQVYLAVAHDLKAPLNGMVLNLELLRESLADGAEIGRDKQRRWVEVLERELVRLRRSLETLLAQTAPASDELERFDLRSTVEEIEDLLAPQARRQQVRLVTDLPAAPVTVEGHRDHLKQALLNVAINGLEVLGEGGTLELALRGDGEAAALAVRDTGPGISPELRQRIFDMHFTTKDNGTGIGLYVARSVVESEGGAIDVADTGPDGTTFMVRLPLAPTAGEEVSA